tara:strand:- start:273 stop:668 length:396 start_codon:yes stop_codon:yes gene_type:complete
MNKINYPENKRFGILFSILLLVLSIIFFLSHKQNLLVIFILLFILLLGITIFRPILLTYPTKVWLYFGKLISLIISPIVLGIIFLFIISPLAIFFKIIKRDELKLKKNKYMSAWITRKEKVYNKKSFKDQF